MKDLKYLAAYLVPLSALLALQWGGAWAWATVVFSFGILPVFDALMPASPDNYTPQEEEGRLKNTLFDWLLYACLPICYALVWLYFETLGTSQPSPAEIAGMTLSMGIVLGSMGINVAHELGHRPGQAEQFLAKMLLLPTLYMHFFIEHNRGHHKHVSTDRDPASAKKGEALYPFWVRSVVGQIRSAWHLEAERLEKSGKPAFGWQNELLRFAFFEALYLVAVGLVFGWGMVPFAVAIALTAVLMLETVNYIEHYGLRRRLLPSGRPEPVSPVHSWNSDHEMGRIFLFELTRHSDHHFKSTRKYQVLRHLDESPQLATGYPGSMLLALVPPLWFRVMDGRIAAASSRPVAPEMLVD